MTTARISRFPGTQEAEQPPSTPLTSGGPTPAPGSATPGGIGLPAGRQPSANTQPPERSGNPAIALPRLTQAPAQDPSGSSSIWSSSKKVYTTELLDSSGALTPDALRVLHKALPHGGAAIGRLMNDEARRHPRTTKDHIRHRFKGEPAPLEKERFGRFMADVLQDIRAVAKQAGPGASLAEAAEAMRKAVESEHLGTGLIHHEKLQTIYVLYGAREAQQARQELAPVLASAHPDFVALPVEQAWRMLMDQGAWGDGKHEGLRFENEPGYLAGMLRGLGKMLEDHRAGRMLDATLYCELHDSGLDANHRLLEDGKQRAAHTPAALYETFAPDKAK